MEARLLMSNKNLFMSSGYMMRDLILQPSTVFNKVKQGELQNEALLVFGVGAVISLLKSFWVKRNYITFFDNSTNNLLSFLSIPQARWFFGYILYFLFVGSVAWACKAVTKNDGKKSLAISFMSISSIGVICQLISFVLNPFTPHIILIIEGYLIFIWCIWLSLYAMKIIQELSYIKAAIIFLIPAIVVFLFIGLAAVAPYLAWLSH